MNQYTHNDILPDDERLEDTRLLNKLQQRAALQQRIHQAVSNTRYGHDQDKIFLGEEDIPQTGDEIALSRNSFFADLNKFNVKNGKRMSNIDQSMLYN